MNENEDSKSYRDDDHEILDEMFKTLEGNVDDYEQETVWWLGKLLYVSCTKLTKLFAVLNDMFPEDNKLPFWL